MGLVPTRPPTRPPARPTQPGVAGPGGGLRPRPRKPIVEPVQRPHVRVLRPRDLLAFTVEWADVDLVRETAMATHADTRSQLPRLVAGPNGGLLTYIFSFQHTAEFTNEPDFPGDESLDANPPIPARAANRSRLVFKLPAGEAVEYSVAGLLDAMGRLELSVAPAATPAPALTGWWAFNPQQLTQMSLPQRLLAAGGNVRLTRVDVTPADGKVTAANIIEGQRGLVAANRLVASELATATGNLRQVLPGVIGGLRPILPPLHTPTATETAIEAPFRLILSPSAKGGWAHAQQPVSAGSGGPTERVELWHSRLAVRSEKGGISESDADQRIVRAIWTRDRDRKKSVAIGSPADPFEHSLRAIDRERIVAQTAGTPKAPKVVPEPVRVRRLALSSLGAWLDIHVRWDYEQYLKAFKPNDPNMFTPLASWDHVAPMGRDQFVRIVEPGYLFPLGHKAFLVTLTYRKIVGATNPQASLFKRHFIVLGDALKGFTHRDLPFVAGKLGPLRTPDLADPGAATMFWPTPLGTATPLDWAIEASDQDGKPIKLKAPLLFVLAGSNNTPAAIASKYKEAGRDTIQASSQVIAFAPALAADQGVAGAQASVETQTITLSGTATIASSEPFLTSARVIVPAIKRLTPSAPPADVHYPDVYKASGFGPANAGNVYLELASATGLSFGSSEHSGGFVQPDVAVAGLARSTGLVSDIGDAALGKFDAAKLFGAGLPKLFGLFSLIDLVPSAALDLAPKFLTEQLDRVAALLNDLSALKAAVQQYALAPALPAKVDAVVTAVKDLLEGDAAAIGTGPVTAALNAVKTEVDALVAAIPGTALDPLARSTFDRLLGGLTAALSAADKIAAILAFVEGLDPGGGEFRATMEWRPHLQNFPATGDPIFSMKDPANALVVSVEARASATHSVGIEVAAQLSDFQLNLIPGAGLMEVHFTRLAFRGGTSRRPEVDVVFGGIEFVGVLSFIEVLKQLIPLDGFSDPPFLDVSAEGVSAGFTVELPNVAIGVFSLTNLSLGADARIPFLGESVSVGFNFCTRDRPFTLAVAFLGGGGFVGIRLNPKGLVLLEAALEFGAVIAIDFGVASGSVSVMAGIYLRLETDAGSLTGYLRIRGEVDVLGLISASIELYMALTYAFDTGKMIGEATIKISVHVLFFSASVSVHAKRQFAGSNGDPTVRQMLLVDAGGNSAVWDDYCAAFAPAGEA